MPTMLSQHRPESLAREGAPAKTSASASRSMHARGAHRVEFHQLLAQVGGILGVR